MVECGCGNCGDHGEDLAETIDSLNEQMKSIEVCNAQKIFDFLVSKGATRGKIAEILGIREQFLASTDKINLFDLENISGLIDFPGAVVMFRSIPIQAQTHTKMGMTLKELTDLIGKGLHSQFPDEKYWS